MESMISILNEDESNNQFNYTPKVAETISFRSIVEQYNLDRIDFIKTDCEGGEYSLFTDANMPYLLNNVRNIVGEFHLSSDFPELKVEFRYFRDKYLKQFPNLDRDWETNKAC